jgi:nucleotide-binding universal stress UspA family protein
MGSNGKKLLVAVDGSEYALEAVRYVSKIAPFKKMQVVLFHVYEKLPALYKDLERKTQFDHRMAREIDALAMRQEAALQEYMQRANQILLDAGFSPDATGEKTCVEEKGIARDIVSEAQSDYSGVVIGRKGISDYEDLVLGSISTKLIEKIDFVPLLVVGKGAKPGKILLALDGSEGAMEAVDYVGKTVGGSDFEVSLIHVIRGGEALKSGYHLIVPTNEYIEEARGHISANFEEAKSRLIELGFKPNQISTKIITGVYSRAVAIFEEAKEGGYGTIVVGRRGLSKVREFFMGRVSNKLIQLAKGQAVWVVS